METARGERRLVEKNLGWKKTEREKGARGTRLMESDRDKASVRPGPGKGRQQKGKKRKRAELMSAGCGCQAVTGNRREEAGEQTRWVPPDRWSRAIIHCLGGRHLSDEGGAEQSTALLARIQDPGPGPLTLM